MKRSAFAVLAGLVAVSAHAAEAPLSYTEQLRQEMIERGESVEPAAKPGAPEPYIQSIKKGLADDPKASKSYIDQLKEQEVEEKESGDHYTDQVRQKLEPKETGGAIQAVTEGRSDLKAKKSGDIRGAFGLRYGLSMNRAITAPAGVQLRAFNDVYGSSYVPEFTLFYEIQPFHSEWFGNVGIMAMGGLGFYRGFGQFGSPIQKPNGSSEFFPLTSQTKFNFFTVPVTIALNYRFNLMRILRPYIMAGPTLIAYSETRDDQKRGNTGTSKAWLLSAGVALSLDGLTPSGGWDVYADYGIHHYYLTVEYQRMIALAGDVDFGISGILAGFTFEF